MAETSKLVKWKAHILFLIFSIITIFLHMVPLNLLASRYLGPDFMLIATIALIIRKASYVPYWLIGVVFLAADILLTRPMGLWAFIVLATIETLRANRMIFRDMLFITEWAFISVVIIIIYMIQQFLLTFSLAPPFPMDRLIWQIGMTILAYPIIVFIITKLFGVRKPSPAELNMLGTRL